MNYLFKVYLFNWVHGNPLWHLQIKPYFSKHNTAIWYFRIYTFILNLKMILFSERQIFKFSVSQLIQSIKIWQKAKFKAMFWNTKMIRIFWRTFPKSKCYFKIYMNREKNKSPPEKSHDAVLSWTSAEF